MAWQCGISPICGCDQSHRSRHLTHTLADLLHDRPRAVQRGGRNVRHCDPACVRPRPRVCARTPARSCRPPFHERSQHQATARVVAGSTRRRGGGADEGLLADRWAGSGRPRGPGATASGCLDGDRDGSANRCARAARGAHQVPVQGEPVLRHAPLQRPQRLAVIADAGRSPVDPSRESPAGAMPAGGRGWRAGLSRPPRATRWSISYVPGPWWAMPYSA